MLLLLKNENKNFIFEFYYSIISIILNKVKYTYARRSYRSWGLILSTQHASYFIIKYKFMSHSLDMLVISMLVRVCGIYMLQLIWHNILV